MKFLARILCVAALVAMFSAQAHATLLVNEPFSEYTNGD